MINQISILRHTPAITGRPACVLPPAHQHHTDQMRSRTCPIVDCFNHHQRDRTDDFVESSPLSDSFCCCCCCCSCSWSSSIFPPLDIEIIMWDGGRVFNGWLLFKLGWAFYYYPSGHIHIYWGRPLWRQTRPTHEPLLTLGACVSGTRQSLKIPAWLCLSEWLYKVQNRL